MKLHITNATTRVGTPLPSLGEVGIDQASIGKLFSIVTEKLYENPIKAVTREIMTNMVDAWLQQRASSDTRTAAPGVVGLPSFENPSIRFRDFGPGMSPEEIRLYVMHILKSGKDDSNYLHGGWGLGMKSPFAYTKSWTITSYRDGIVYKMATTMQASGIPEVLMLEPPSTTQEENGLEIMVPVRTNDISTFRLWARWWTLYMPEDSITLDTLSEEEKRGDILHYDTTFSGSIGIDGQIYSWKFRTDSSIPPDLKGKSEFRTDIVHHTWQPRQLLRLVLGSIPYFQIPADLEQHKGRLFPLDIFLPIGSVGITPDRDRLSFTDEHTATIRRVIEAAIEQMQDRYLQFLEDKLPYETLVWPEESAFGLLRKNISLPPRIKTRDGLEVSIASNTVYVVHIDEELQHISQLLRTKELLPEDKVAGWHLRQRSRGETRVGEMKYLEGDDEDYGDAAEPLPPQAKLHIDRHLQAVYWNDIGIGVLDRVSDAEITASQEAYRRTDYIWLITPSFSTVRTMQFTEEERLDITKRLATALGMPLSRVFPISVIDKPVRETVTLDRKTTGSTVVVTRHEPLSAQHLHTHPLVKIFGCGTIRYNNIIQESSSRDYYGVFVRDWPYNCDPASTSLWVVPTKAGAFSHPHLPNTTGATADEGWSSLPNLPNGIWNLRSDSILFAPSNIADALLAQEGTNYRPFLPRIERNTETFLYERLGVGLSKIRIAPAYMGYGEPMRAKMDALEKYNTRMKDIERACQKLGVAVPRDLQKVLRISQRVLNVQARFDHSMSFVMELIRSWTQEATVDDIDPALDGWRTFLSERKLLSLIETRNNFYTQFWHQLSMAAESLPEALPEAQLTAKVLLRRSRLS